MPERDRLQLGPATMTDQTRHEQVHRLSSIGALTMLAGGAGRLVDHPCINHWGFTRMPPHDGQDTIAASSVRLDPGGVVPTMIMMPSGITGRTHRARPRDR